MTLTPRENNLLSNTDVLGYIQAQNAARSAQAVAEGWQFWTLMSEDIAARFANVYELEHSMACGSYSDTYKECYYGRPTHAYGKWTLVQLEAATAELS